MHVSLDTLIPAHPKRPTWHVVESRSTVMVSRMAPRDARRLVRAAAARGLDAEVVEPPLPDMDWGAVILKPLSGEGCRD